MKLDKFDTSKKSNSGVFLHLVAPDGAKIYDEGVDGKRDLSKPVGLIMLGVDSKHYQDVKHKRANDRRIGGDKITSEMVEDENIQLLADLTTGWQNLEVDGDSKYSRENVLKLYVKYPWAREQANAFAGNRANFI